MKHLISNLTIKEKPESADSRKLKTRSSVACTNAYNLFLRASTKNSSVEQITAILQF